MSKMMEDKMKIQEVIVVEGKDDTKRIKMAVNADTIETRGSAISDETLDQIAELQEKRGVIVFTDPDYSGEKIRKTIRSIASRRPKSAHPRRERRYNRDRPGRSTRAHRPAFPCKTLCAR